MGSVTRGGKKLASYIRTLGVSPDEWARENGIHRTVLWRVLRGNVSRVSANFAFAVERATAGKVEAVMFENERHAER